MMLANVYVCDRITDKIIFLQPTVSALDSEYFISFCIYDHDFLNSNELSLHNEKMFVDAITNLTNTQISYLVTFYFYSTFCLDIYFFLNSVLRPFHDYFSSYETGQSVGGRKRENSEKKHLAHPQAELGLSHM